VSARLDAARTLVLTVSNTGAARGPDGHGVGLSNLEKRLRAHYGEAGGVRLERNASGGAVATVHLPFESGGNVAVVAS
jgi:LytS/YehU family sensor histidine kinase